MVDSRTNTIFVQDTPSRLDEVRKLLRKVDVPVRQVMIESRIVEATDTFGRNLGVRLGYHDQTGQGTKIGSQDGTPVRVVPGGNLVDTGFHTGQVAQAPPFE